MDDFFSSPNSREVIIAKYTDKSRYKPEYIYGDVYVDEDRISLSNKNTREKEIFERELAAAKRFSKHFNCEVFLLPEGDENGNAIYVDKNSNPDFITNGIFVDFKQAKGTDTSITKQFARGLGQADGVVITMDNDTSLEQARRWINGKLNALAEDYSGFIVVIEDNKGNYETYSVNEKRLSMEENLSSAARRLSPSNCLNNTLIRLKCQQRNP